MRINTLKLLRFVINTDEVILNVLLIEIVQKLMKTISSCYILNPQTLAMISKIYKLLVNLATVLNYVTFEFGSYANTGC